MTPDGDTQKLKSALLSGKIEDQVEPLSSIQHFLNEVLPVAVKGLGVSPVPVIYAERLSTLGPLVLPHLRTEMDSLRGEARFHAAALLLFFDDRSHIQDLITELKAGGPNELIAARFLARAGIAAAADCILFRLNSFTDEDFSDPKKAPYFQAFLNALVSLKVDLPLGLQRRIRKGSEYLTIPDVR